MLTTHKHWDHAGGNSELRKSFPDIPFYGSKIDRPDQTDHFLYDEDEIDLGNTKVWSYLTPCHTLGHTIFEFETPGNQAYIFTGDFLFCGGVGKFFEGDAKMKWDSISTFLEKADPNSLLFYGHEYADDSFKFLNYLD